MDAGLRVTDAERLDAHLRAADELSGQPVSRYVAEGPMEVLTGTDVAQPALFAVSAALAEVAADCGLEPDFVTGHSLGEYTAAAAAGALDPGDAMRLVCERGRLMAAIQDESPGAMAATGGVSEERLAELCAQAAEGDALGPANLNSPRQIVVSGTVGAVERLLALLDEEPGARAMRLPVGAAFHSTLMVPVRDALRGPLDETAIAAPRVPVVANHSGRPVADAEGVREALVEQIANPVRFADCVRSLADAGCTDFLELGPGKVLTGLVRQVAGREVNAAAADSREKIEAFRAS
jgi:[acyl-carrier-protein] S-malonyltransferase